jgi:ribosome-binding factor A
MVSQARARRIANRIWEELAVILQQEISDPRLSMVTITGVDVDRELAYATIYISALDAHERIDEILRALKGAQGHLRSRLAAKIPLRSFPQLRFRQDASPYRGARIDELLAQLKQEREDTESGDRE